jgi:hypothetical protein
MNERLLCSLVPNRRSLLAGTEADSHRPPSESVSTNGESLKMLAYGNVRNNPNAVIRGEPALGTSLSCGVRAVVFRQFVSAFQSARCLFVVDGMLPLSCSATQPSGDDQVVALLGLKL